ncbi:unnamed protein product [Alopecurus aequalis]
MPRRAAMAGNSSALFILESGSTSYQIFFGFYTMDGHAYTLSVLLLGGQAPVIWSANPDNPVSQDAILNITKEGNLLLNDGDGTMIWSTDTKSNSAAGMRLDFSGNLVLFDQNNYSFWKSFNHPTDTLVLGQSLCRGMNISVKPSNTKWPSARIYLSAEFEGLKKEEEQLFDSIPGAPKRFSFHELKLATSNFSVKLGSGGFGSVFKGKIGRETVAVKRLEGVAQGTEEFLAEVMTIGRMHHHNLVRLIGFCAEKSHRLLVYEYLCNGSLDKWIFHACSVFTLSWKTRRNIIMAIAKGLSYLHEECNEKIAHLDIKPQNILLDDRFNAKLSDFGLSKMINRDQSKIMTRMRGTRGYLAPEWLGSKITEKADIYSFGVVVVEIICGRENLDESLPEESNHLISLLEEKARSGQLLDLVDSGACRLIAAEGP